MVVILVRHTLVHSGEKPAGVICVNFADYAFGVARHFRVHMGEKPIECICSIKYIC